MAQLLQKQVPTVPFTNAVLRNIKDFGMSVELRIDGVNYPDFAKLSVFKDLVLDLGRQVCAEYISDASILILRPGERLNLNETQNRLLLCLENSSSFARADDGRFVPDTGDLIWTNEALEIQNTSAAVSILLVVDFNEFLL